MEQVRGPRVGRVWPTLTIVPASSRVLLAIPAHSSTGHLQLLLQARDQRLLPAGVGASGQGPDGTFQTGSKTGDCA